MGTECDNRANEIWLWLERHWVRWGENVALSKNVNHYGPWTGFRIITSKNVNHYGPWTGFRIITSKNVNDYGPWTGFRIITSKNVNHYGPWTGFRIITSKNVNHYGPWTGFSYYNLTTLYRWCILYPQSGKALCNAECRNLGIAASIQYLCIKTPALFTYHNKCLS